MDSPYNILYINLVENNCTRLSQFIKFLLTTCLYINQLVLKNETYKIEIFYTKN